MAQSCARALGALSFAACLAALPAHAQQNLDKLKQFKVAPSTNMLFVGTRKTTVWAVTDRNSDGIADEVKSFAPSLKFSNPNGVCWTKDGFLIVAEHNRVLNFPAAEFFYEGPDVAVIEVVPQGKLIPPEEESFNHGARVCKIGPDGMLYVSLGQPFNVPPRDKLKMYSDLGIGGMIRMNAFDGSKREVYATGIRNSVGHDFNPKDGTLWFTDNQPTAWATTSRPARSTASPRPASSSAIRGSRARRASRSSATTRTRCPATSPTRRSTWTPTPPTSA